MKVLCGCAVLLLFASSRPSPAQDVLVRAKADIEKLSSRELSGRGYAFDGLQKAAAFLETRFMEIGLQPVAQQYAQPFEIRVNTFEAPPQLILNDEPLALGRDFLPAATSGSGSVSSGTSVFYVNAGLFVPNKGINDYAVVTSEGAILVIDEDVPDAIRKDTTIDHRLLAKEIRIKLAEQLHPAAILFLVTRLGFGSPSSQEEIPVLDIAKDRSPSRISKVSLDVKASFEDRPSMNLVGMLPGSGRSDSCIVMCAHFDHLGAFSDSAYFPGANDNASGTAMLLSLASHFRSHPVRSSIIFIATSGEEEGLLGSQYYAEHPLHNLGKTKFLMNFDIVGSGDGSIMVVGGENFPAEFSLMTSLCDSLKIKPLGKRPTVANSDQYFFSTKGVKTFYFYTMNGKQPYHRFDDVCGTLDWEAYENVFRLATAFVERMDR